MSRKYTVADVTQELGPDFNGAGFQRGSLSSDLKQRRFMDLVVTSLNAGPYLA